MAGLRDLRSARCILGYELTTAGRKHELEDSQGGIVMKSGYSSTAFAVLSPLLDRQMQHSQRARLAHPVFARSCPRIVLAFCTNRRVSLRTTRRVALPPPKPRSIMLLAIRFLAGSHTLIRVRCLTGVLRLWRAALLSVKHHQTTVDQIFGASRIC